jgi:hypothetical protein
MLPGYVSGVLLRSIPVIDFGLPSITAILWLIQLLQLSLFLALRLFGNS